MRKLIGVVALILGVVGVIGCASAIGFGWWTAARAIDRVDRVAGRLDQGLSESDARLAEVQSRLNFVRSDIEAVRQQAEKLVAENPELPRVREAIERLLARLVPALDRADATAGSLRTIAAGLRAAADLVDDLADAPPATGRLREAANTIDRAAEALNVPRARIETVQSAGAVRLTRELIVLVRQAVAGCELLARGLTAVRQEVAIARKRTEELRSEVVYRLRMGTIANTGFWFWGGLGQLCLAGWGRRRLRGRPKAGS